jgi:hypothetical protein
MNSSFSFLPPSTPDPYDEMEVDCHDGQLLPSTVGLEDADPMDLDNEAQNIAPRMPFGDVTARIEHAQNPSDQAQPATVPSHARAVLIVFKRSVKGPDKVDAKIGAISKDCENLLQETVKEAAKTLCVMGRK